MTRISNYKKYRFYKKYFTLFVILVLSVHLHAEEFGTLKEVKNSYLELKKDNVEGIIAVKLIYLDKDGVSLPTNEIYICLYLKDSYPIISKKIDGHSIQLKLFDIDNDNDKELLAFYNAGGHQFCLSIFKIIDDKLIQYENCPITSNMRSINLISGEIIVKNLIINSDGTRNIISDAYSLKNYKCILKK